MAFSNRLPGPRVVSLNVAHASDASHHHMTSDEGDLESEAHTTAHDDFETAFAEAQRLAGGKPTFGGMKGSTAGHSVFPNGPGKGPSHDFPWRSYLGSTTDRGWQPELNQSDQRGRGYRSQLNEVDPEPAMFRRYVESHHDHFGHRDVFHEAPPADRECDNPQRDSPPTAPHDENWFWPPRIGRDGQSRPTGERR